MAFSFTVGLTGLPPFVIVSVALSQIALLGREGSGRRQQALALRSPGSPGLAGKAWKQLFQGTSAGTSV